MLTSVVAPRCSKSCSKDCASAEPSSGSVPAPISSRSTNECAFTVARIRVMFPMWDENVERFCSIDCSSPISAKIPLKIGSVAPAFTGSCSPHADIRVSSPMVFNATVFPPVLGPVITTILVPGSRLKLIGTTHSGCSNGCRASCIRIGQLRPDTFVFMGASINTGSVA